MRRLPLFTPPPPQEKSGPVYRKPDKVELPFRLNTFGPMMKSLPTPDPVPQPPIPFKIYNQAQVQALSDNGFGTWINRVDGMYDEYINFYYITTLATDLESNSYSILTSASPQVIVYNKDGTVFKTVSGLDGYYCSFLVKYDSNGYGVWVNKVIGTEEPPPGYRETTSVCVDKDGNVYMSFSFEYVAVIYSGETVATTINGNNQNRVVVVKYNKNGVYQWNSNYTGGDSYINSMVTDNDNNLIVAGAYFGDVLTLYNSTGDVGSTLPNPFGQGNLYVKYTSSGIISWAARSDGSSGCYPFNIKVDSEGNVYICGITNDTRVFLNADGTSFIGYSNSTNFSWLLKYNKDGIGQWGCKLGQEPQYCFNCSIVVDGNNNIYLSGVYYQDGATIFDKEDNIVRTLPGPTGDDQGYSSSYLVKYSKQGEVLWSMYNNTIYDYFPILSIDAYNNIYVVITLEDAIPTFRNRDGSVFKKYTSAIVGSTQNVYLYKYNSEGDGIWVSRLSVPSFAYLEVEGISVDQNNSVLLHGTYGSPDILIYNQDDSLSAIRGEASDGDATYVVQFGYR